MTASTTSTLPASNPQRTRSDPADQPERPGTIPWELLGASDYRTALTDLGSWLAWLVPTYRIPPSVIPPCWFLHPGLIEELGHLWTGWRITRHPDAGVGMVGLEWDGHREHTTGRLRELVATAGCSGTTHSIKPGPALNRDRGLWTAALQTETELRTIRSSERAVLTAAEEVLIKAEVRNNFASEILGDIAADPAHPTATEIDRAQLALKRRIEAAAAEAQQRGLESRAHLDHAAGEALLSNELAAARNDLLGQIAIGFDAADLEQATRRWIAAATNALPAEQEFRWAAAASAGKSAARDHLTSTDARHGVAAALLSRPAVKPASTDHR